MTNAPPTRKTHIIRIVGTNKNGDVLQDIWADVERVDIAKSTTQTLQGGWQGYQRKHLWMDDPDADNYDPDGNPARKTEIVKVCDPSDDVDDPEQWIPIPVIRSMKSRGYDGNIPGLGTQSRFRTGIDDDDPSVTTRIIEVRKISHCDTSIDDDAQAAFDADSNRTAYVVPGDQYDKDLSTKDDSQFVDHEIVTYLKHRFNETNDDDGSVNRGLQTKLLNQYLIDESDPADGIAVGANGINPPYRLDPYQNIVNVQLTPDVIVVFVDDGLGPLGLTLLVDANKVKDTEEFTFSSTFAGTAFRVSSSIGSFMQTTLYGGSLLAPVPSAYVYVFATNGDPDKGMSRAIDGAKAIQNAPDVVAGNELGPPGLLWSVQVFQFPFNASLTWKLRRGKHRNDKDAKNSIVQCYPLGVTPSTLVLGATDPSLQQHLTYYGYQLNCYRIDAKGTGPLYGSRAQDAGASAIDPAWYQHIETIVMPPANPDELTLTAYNYGIPFQDPPPLISEDIE